MGRHASELSDSNVRVALHSLTWAKGRVSSGPKSTHWNVYPDSGIVLMKMQLSSTGQLPPSHTATVATTTETARSWPRDRRRQRLMACSAPVVLFILLNFRSPPPSTTRCCVRYKRPLHVRASVSCGSGWPGRPTTCARPRRCRNHHGAAAPARLNAPRSSGTVHGHTVSMLRTLLMTAPTSARPSGGAAMAVTMANRQRAQTLRCWEPVSCLTRRKEWIPSVADVQPLNKNELEQSLCRPIPSQPPDVSNTVTNLAVDLRRHSHPRSLSPLAAYQIPAWSWAPRVQSPPCPANGSPQAT
jgi:hypothetical protein